MFDGIFPRLNLLGIPHCDWTDCDPVIFELLLSSISRIILLGHGHLNNSVCSILLAITWNDLVLIVVISNEPVAGSIMVLVVCMFEGLRTNEIDIERFPQFDFGFFGW